MFQGCFKGVSRRSEECFKEVPKVFQESLKSVSRKFEECFKEVL